MPEREDRTLEQVNLYERGGLTPAHWQEVIKLIRKTGEPCDEMDVMIRYGRRLITGKPIVEEPQDEQSKKVVAYARKVISGEYSDHDFHHRQYLGCRIWNFISVLAARDRTKRPRILLPWPRTEQTDNQLVEEIDQYATAEQKGIFNLDDYFDVYLVRQGIVTLNYGQEHLRWSIGVWKLFENVSEEGEYPYYEERGNADEGSLLNKWLLTKSEVIDPIHTSPEELYQIVRDEVPVEVLKERLRQHLDSQQRKIQLIGNWEKEI